jgi:hypothetical protein
MLHYTWIMEPEVLQGTASYEAGMPSRRNLECNMISHHIKAWDKPDN